MQCYEYKKITENDLEVRKEKLLIDIKIAFDGVVLGDGIGAEEARAIDNYIHEDSKEYLLAKKHDQEISERHGDHMSKLADSYFTMLMFGDIKGQKFALPASMTYNLTREPRKYQTDIVPEELFASLTPEQQRISSEYLRLLKDANNSNRIKDYITIKNINKVLFDYPLDKYSIILLAIFVVCCVLYLLLGFN